jgi:hypothetical protein
MKETKVADKDKKKSVSRGRKSVSKDSKKK